jgi:hypothetical protein
MIALFRPPLRASKSRFRPSLESLEARDCPSSGSGGTNRPPAITLQVQYLQQNNIVLSGRVTDESPAGLTVSFTGLYAGSCVTGSDGSFSKSVAVSATGSVGASTRDNLNQASNIALAMVSTNAPAIVNFQAVNQIDNIWVISGHVVDESAANLVVYLNGLGLSNVAVQVGADGNFSYTTELAADVSGVLTAQTTDWFGVSSQTAETLV